jgi:hypothetical protein
MRSFVVNSMFSISNAKSAAYNNRIGVSTIFIEDVPGSRLLAKRLLSRGQGQLCAKGQQDYVDYGG